MLAGLIIKNHKMGRVANVIGASGLVGQQIINQLLFHSEFDKIRIFVRRKTRFIHPKLEEQIIDFDQPESWRHLVQGDVLFSTLGTTIKTVKTKKNQYRVDFTYQYEFAKAAFENGVSTYILISSMGANAKSFFFYTRMKGELEESVKKLNFKRIIIFRPSILDGNRSEKRIGEKMALIFSRYLTRIILKKNRPTPVRVLVSKMVSLSVDQTDGLRLVEGLEILN
ncbi:MAG TPA: NADH-quinone oxidoreductase subunit F [Prolixibacteraceae bacterium]|nr:NADH-quinone oxidoreductase subunit F [Prolixibacteraceae bacterium]